MYRNNQNLKHNKTMDKNSITENDIRATLSGRKEYFETKVYRFVNFALYLLFGYTSKWGYDNY